MVGQPAQHALVTIGERPRRAVVDEDHALDSLAGPDRHCQRRHRALRDDELGVGIAEARVGAAVVGAHGASAAPRQPAEAHAALDPHALVVRLRADTVTHVHGVRAGVPERDARNIGSAQLARSLGDAHQNDVELQRRTDRARHLRQHLGLAAASLGVGVEARILQRERGLVGEGLGARDFLGRKAPARRVADDQRPERAARHDERHREHRPVCALRELGARLGRVGEARVGDHVGGRARRSRRERPARHAGATVQAPLPDERTVGLEHRVGHEHAAVGVRPIDRRRTRVEQPADVLGDAARDDRRIERLQQQPADLGQRLGGLASGIAVGVEPRVRDRHRRLRGEQLEHLAMPHRERRLAHEREHRDQRVAVDHRQCDQALIAPRLPPVAPGDACVFRGVGDPGGLAMLGDPAGDALAIAHDGGGIGVDRPGTDLAQRQRARRLVGNPEADLGGADQVRRLAPDGVEDRVDPQTRRNQPAKARQSSEIRSRRAVVPG